VKLLIVGGGGMAGHVIRRYLMQQTDWEVWATFRGGSRDAHSVSLDVRDVSGMEKVLEEIRPDAVINAVGLLNEDARIRQAEAIYVNSLFPHMLTSYGNKLGFRLLHISTDCVFSGSRGSYIESDLADGISVYAKSKSLGEVAGGHHLTIRTSIIGPELNHGGIGLFHWFMQQKGDIQGYSQVFWNGVTTLELAKAIEWCLRSPRPVEGLVHLAAPKKLSKYELLLLLQEQFRLDAVVVHSSDAIRSDKSLVSTRPDFTYAVSPYPQMLAELKIWMDTHGKGLYAY
jgi:dTDP-4-dehydrorhamnose reductase